jgi:hypothetical protein
METGGAGAGGELKEMLFIFSVSSGSLTVLFFLLITRYYAPVDAIVLHI